MQNLRENPLTEIAGYKVVSVTDYTKPEETGLPSANVLIYKLDNNETVIGASLPEQSRRSRSTIRLSAKIC